jgi:polyisoprenoid-binding protein YceI
LHYALNQTRPPEAATVRYLTDAKRSRFMVHAFATGMLSAFAHSPTIAIPDFDGQAVVNPEVLEESSLRFVVQAASLKVTDDVNETDRVEMERRMCEEVLESGSYPEIVYECSKVSASKTGEGQYWVALNGQRSLCGTTRSQPMSARVTLDGDNITRGWRILHAAKRLRNQAGLRCWRNDKTQRRAKALL